MADKICIACEAKDLNKETIAINIKLLGDNITNYYCINCLSEYLECSVEDIYDKIEMFKEDGCNLFK